VRFGLGARIVATIAGILLATLAAIESGSTHLETRIVAAPAAAQPAMPAVAELAGWFAARHSWVGADARLARLSHPLYVSVVVSGGRVRAASQPRFDGAVATVDSGGTLSLSLPPSAPSMPSARSAASAGEPRSEELKFTGLAGRPIVVNGTVAGRLYVIPSPSLLPRAIPSPPDAAFRRRFMVVFLLVSAFALLVAILLATYIVKPIRELTVAAQTASSAALPRVPARAGDEIGDLARAFNALGERLMRSEAARRDLVSDVAHELRTPLTNVRCALEAFQDGIDEPSPQALRAVLADVLLLQRLVTDLHELSIGDSASPSLERVPTDILGEVRSAVAAFGDRALARNVRIEVVAPEPAQLVACDPARVRQVLHNLLENALRYGRPGGCVAVEITPGRQGVRVAVKDDGDGFAASDEAPIFERFHRLDASRSRSTGGSGLGLAIAKQLIETQGGRIGASGGSGRGATVWFTLPSALA